MKDNYPDGAANDPRAPWNQKDPEMVECPECGGSGIIDDEEEAYECEHCNGTGEVEEEEQETDEY